MSTESASRLIQSLRVMQQDDYKKGYTLEQPQAAGIVGIVGMVGMVGMVGIVAINK